MGIDRQDITGLVLAGGRGSRMGGVDKGLQQHLGTPLAAHALARLRPQVGGMMISANRNLAAYAAMGVPVWPDTQAGFPGPLAGLLAGLQRCASGYLASVPCDTPDFPLDLVQRLAAALAGAGAGAEIAMAATVEAGEVRTQPVFCLLRTSLAPSLTACLHAGERKLERWAQQQRCVVVPFHDVAAFANANTVAELQRLQPRRG